MSLIAELAPGTVIGGAYRIQQHLRDGGQGSIYVAEQLGTGHLRALKLMLPSLVHDERLRKLFMQEARVGAHIRSDHVVQVLGAGIDDLSGMPWMAMELLEGEDLADLLARREHLEPKEVLDIFKQLCHALFAAHMVGIVHRDLKPENIFLAESRTQGQPFTIKVLDFGLAKLLYSAAPSSSTGVAKGTWTFLAPEQTEERGQILPSTDVWALGLLAYRLLTGYSYWSSACTGMPSVQVLLREILHDPLPPPSERAARFGFGERIPRGFDKWFARCVVREVDKRYHDAGEAGEALQSALSGAPTVKMATIDPQHRSTSESAPGSGDSFALGDTLRPTGPMGHAGPVSQVRAFGAESSGRRPATPPLDERDADRVRRRNLTLGLVALGGSALLCLGLASAWRARYSTEARQRSCDAASATGATVLANARQLDDCAHACDAGSAHHCRLYADLVFRDVAPPAAARDRGLSGYHQACDHGDLDACRRYADFLDGATGRVDPAIKIDSSAASRLYDHACGLGDLPSCLRLGVLLDEGRGVPRDRRRSLVLLNRACDGKLAEACARIAALLESSRRDESDFETAVSLHSTACEHGRPDSCTRYGRLVLLGRGEARDPVKALGLFQRGCDGGDDPACLKLARRYLDGQGVPREPARALALYQTLCERHYADGCLGLGVLYRDGLAVGHDPKRAAQLFAEACDGGRARACSSMGELVDAGQGFARKDHARALDLYNQACDAGDGFGCRDLARASEDDPANKRDKSAANKLYERAFGLFRAGCEAGTASLCAEQAHLLLDGKGAARDLTRAATVYNQACQWNDAGACGALGQLFLTGRGVPRDLERARPLLQRACDGGDASACAQQKLPPPKYRAPRPSGKPSRSAQAPGPGKPHAQRAPHVAVKR